MLRAKGSRQQRETNLPSTLLVMSQRCDFGVVWEACHNYANVAPLRHYGCEWLSI